MGISLEETFNVYANYLLMNINTSVAYNDVGAGVYMGGTGLQTDILNPLWDGALKENNVKSNVNGGDYAIYDGANEVKYWNAIAEVTVMQNMYVHAEYAFAADGEAYGNESDDVEDTWTVSLNYVF